jgi:hypothetical protein
MVRVTSEARAGAGEAVFRDVNERVAEIDRAHGIPQTELASFLCECAETTCLARVALPIAEYERIRASATWFVLLPGHEQPEFERVVEQADGYVVVQKHGEAAEVARDRDPR